MRIRDNFLKLLVISPNKNKEIANAQNRVYIQKNVTYCPASP